MKFLKDVFIAHAGNSSNSAATASSTSTSDVSGTPALQKPKAILSLKNAYDCLTMPATLQPCILPVLLMQ